MRKSVKALIATGLTVGILGLAGAAWAWFTESATAQAQGGRGAQMLPLTTGAAAYVYEPNQTGLYPNHFADVEITVTNPADNGATVAITDVLPAATNPKAVTRVVPAAQDTPENRAECTGKLNLAGDPSFAPKTEDLELAPGQSVTLVLDNAVQLDYTADNTCQGMTFTTRWDVTSESR